jgi:glycosyltransferase involved in cell wall biosynthesis
VKLLVTMKLSDRSLRNHIAPIASADMVEGIFVVRDAPGPEIKNVTYISPGGGRSWPPVVIVLAKFISLVRVSLTEKPPLLHSYLFFPHGLLTLIAGKITGRKSGLSMIAGPVEAYSYGGSPIGSYSYCHPLPPSGPGSRILLSLLKRFDIITVTGTFTKKFLTDRGFDPSRIFVLPHAVDDRFKPSGVDKDIDVVFVGRLAPVKHVETLIRAIATVKESLPSVRVVIVGDGESKGDLQGLTTSLGLDDQIEFAGFQENAWDWYNRSKLSVLTSEREGFPYTVIESLCCGVPPVVSNCGDVGDVVRDSFNGRIISDYSDYHAYASVLIELLATPERIELLSRNCRPSVEHLDSDSIVRVWNDILTTIRDQTALERSSSAAISTD